MVIGTSAGGVAALRALAAGLPADLPAPVCVVQHIGRHRSELPALLVRSGPLPATHAEDGEPLRDGHIYVAPPDYHLIVATGHLHLSRGPRENFARPAIDPLFRSAAEAYGPDAIGVILTGRLNDGTAGLYEIKRRGGIAVVQAPADAEHADMPASALAHVEIDHCVPLAEIAPLLTRLAAAAVERPVPQPAKEAVNAMSIDYALHRPVALTCPDCGGAIERQDLGTLTQYRCHIGHSYTAEALVAAQLDGMESGIATALRLINERIETCRQMAERPGVTNEKTKAAWLAAMQEAEQRVDAISELLSAGWMSPEE
ncbi:MAG TPA: chemotaxis protein CheB [Gammaproteobacteria bacterium]|jgi:two-component system chemotaxis response regulator CheB|nr:chemotaxis protein CheB [Gammaproteobacteria bacterium]